MTGVAVLLGPETYHSVAFSVNQKTAFEGGTIMIVYFKRGDKIWTEGPWGTQHYGIFLGYDAGGMGYVVHNNKGTGVEQTTYDVFSNGNDVFLDQAAPNDPRAQEEIAQRALSLKDQQYDLIWFNCEHFANYAHTGNAYSMQMIGWSLAALVGLVAIRPLFAR